MKILHINAGNMYGGVEAFLVTLARCARLCPEMEPHFACCVEGRFSEELGATGAAVHLLGGVRASRFWAVWEGRRRLRELLRRSPADAVICHMPWNYAVFGPAVRQTETPLVFWAHGLAHGRGWVERWARATRPDLAVCNSRFTQASLPRLFADVPNEVIYYPVAMTPADPSARSAIRRQLGISPESVVITQVSRMEAWKGHSLHLRALGRLKDLPGWNCCIVGGPQQPVEEGYLNRIKAEAAQLGISGRVHFLGQRHDVPQILAASDIFCQPNEAPEPFGIVFIEALWAGLPVVTTRLGAAAEIITGEEGQLVSAGDAGSLAACLGDLIQSPERRRALGRRGPVRARALCDAGTQITHLYQTVAGLTRSAACRPAAS